mmetsp:Transcript_11692/g.16603  ORF Transcript_11692/g.16603 Transcript_11692/m.16603 type:complete len:89 (-) Transcript_11692:2452-2718(-)
MGSFGCEIHHVGRMVIKIVKSYRKKIEKQISITNMSISPSNDLSNSQTLMLLLLFVCLFVMSCANEYLPFPNIEANYAHEASWDFSIF